MREYEIYWSEVVSYRTWVEAESPEDAVRSWKVGDHGYTKEIESDFDDTEVIVVDKESGKEHRLDFLDIEDEEE